MRVAALYDIHGNLPALEAVLEDIRRLDVDVVIVGGDVLPGPMPISALEVLEKFERPVQFIYGNGEVAVLEQIAGRDPAGIPAAAREIIRWNAEQIDTNRQRRIASWPKTLRLEVAALGSILFCHATPRNENELFTRLTPEKQLLGAFEEVDADVVVCGHTHMQFDRVIGSVRVVNAGSVGMPFGKPGAYWLLIGTSIEFRRCEYDLEKAAERIRQSRYPQAEDFAVKNVLDPPSEERMLEAFLQAEASKT